MRRAEGPRRTAARRAGPVPDGSSHAPPPPRAWLGVDFSGSQAQWRAGKRAGNVWVARLVEQVEQAGQAGQGSGLALADLGPVQALPGEGPPFERLAALLSAGEFEAAAIDAPFSVPARFAPDGHRALLDRVAALPCEGPFPRGGNFVLEVAGGLAPLTPPKPLRLTEQLWARRPHGVPTRSTLWVQPRGGAPFAAACLRLLALAKRPMWPWTRGERGLLVEGFPSAQLRVWGLSPSGYNGEGPAARRAREAIVASLEARVSLGRHRAAVLSSADALDAVVCAFGAIAVTEGKLAEAPSPDADLEREGWIAVHA